MARSAAGGRVEIVERLLHRRVLDRIELEAPERGVEGEQRVPGPPAAAARRPAGARVGVRPAGSLGALPRARGSRRCAPRGPCRPPPACRISRASAVRILPRAIAAQARVSDDSFSLSSPRGSSMPLSAFSAAGARDGAVGLEERHLLGEIHLLHALPQHDRLDPLERALVAPRADDPHRGEADAAVVVLDRLVHQRERRRGAELGQRLHRGEPHGGIAVGDGVRRVPARPGAGRGGRRAPPPTPAPASPASGGCGAPRRCWTPPAGPPRPRAAS